jgi:predicted RND superfamily exporter protein
MFSVVGLLGMTGIIINDSIVLVTTIDGYAEERGIIPSIIEGTAERLRPVMLTTLTTVLGLTPLLFERSLQAQFLKPTVITLVYGLGFGVLLVLLVVPALLAAQQDVGKMLRSYRRAVKARALRVLFAVTSLLIAAWFVATLGWYLILGQIHPVLLSSKPFTEVDGFAPAMLYFSAGAALLSFLAYIIGLAGVVLRRRRMSAG